MNPFNSYNQPILLILATFYVIYSLSFQGVMARVQKLIDEPMEMNLRVGERTNVTCDMNTGLRKGSFIQSSVINTSNKQTPALSDDITIEVSIQMSQKGIRNCMCQLSKPDSISFKNCRIKTLADEDYKEKDHLKCISYNLERLECSWSLYHGYNAETIYGMELNLEYGNSSLSVIKCRNIITYNASDSGVIKKCNWNISQYRFPSSDRFIGVNLLGKNDRKEELKILKQAEFDHYAHIKPESPRKLKVIDQVGGKITLQWLISEKLWNTSVPWLYKVRFQCLDRHCKETESLLDNVTTSLLTTNQASLYLPNAPGAYKIHLHMKSGYMTTNDTSFDWWSSPVSVTVKSVASAPAKHPSVNRNAFEIEYLRKDRRCITVHWVPLLPYEWNGYYGHYIVEFSPSQTVRGEHGYITVNHSNYGGKVFNKSEPSSESSCTAEVSIYEQYSVRVIAVNEMGEAFGPVEDSIIVPHIINHLPPLTVITTFNFLNNTYELFWKRTIWPANLIQQHTIFYCLSSASTLDAGRKCDQLVGWTNVYKNDTRARVTVSPITDLHSHYEFAVSATSFDEHSTGMIWSECESRKLTPSSSDLLIPLTDIDRVHKPNSIVFHWELSCSQRTYNMVGYNIIYCHATQEYPFPCATNTGKTNDDSLDSNSNLAHMTTTFFPEGIASDGVELKHLMSNRFYRIYAQVVYRTAKSSLSNVMFDRTPTYYEYETVHNHSGIDEITKLMVPKTYT